MLNLTRIKRLYFKDLLDILRDRRTLIAMIVVPIVLYPLLMLGSIQAASLQADQLKEEPIAIGVQSENVARWLHSLLHYDAERIDQEREAAEAQGIKVDDKDPVRDFRIEVVQDTVDLEAWVKAPGGGDCAVVLPLRELRSLDKPVGQMTLNIKVPLDSAEIRSSMAGRRVWQALERCSDFLSDDALRASGVPEAVLAPFVVQQVDVASATKRGGSMLGQIIPLILILMTITGAIYPAIDLTAGERERGTLETLMVCPVPVVEIIIGKFLVVASVALMGATLNLCSMGLTLQFGGFSKALAGGADTEIPVSVLPLILLFLVPLAILFSAVLLAVCSFARTFKEAQNYITPVIISALVPAGLAALPGSELEGVTTVMPVANMVLLTRELLLGNADAGVIVMVVLSTCLYAATAVAVAVKIFGQEAVMFADSGSWRAQFDRRMIQPRSQPTSTLALMYSALLFPVWFYLQSALQFRSDDFGRVLTVTQMLMILCFAIIPMLLVVYYKVNLVNAFALRKPSLKHLAAGLLLGLSTWALAHEATVFQKSVGLFGISDDWVARNSSFGDDLMKLPWIAVLLLIAIVPGICEEVLFRGLLLSGLKQAVRKWPALLAAGLIFAAYHYLIQRFVVTFGLGLLLGYLCWQARSILPGVIAHVLHNGILILLAIPAYEKQINGLLHIPQSEEDKLFNLPWHIVIPAMLLLGVGVMLCRRSQGVSGLIGPTPPLIATQLSGQ